MVYRNFDAFQEGRMTSTEYYNRDIKIALGLLPNISPAVIVGERFGLSANSTSSIWTGPNATQNYTYTDSVGGDRITHVSSNDASEDAIIVINGLDEDWLEITQPVTLNGQNKVALPVPLIRINGAQATKDLVGSVYIYEDTAITSGVPDDLNFVKGFIHSDLNVMSLASYSVPKDHVAIIKQYYAQVLIPNSASDICLDFRAKLFGGPTIRSARLPFSNGNNNISTLTLSISFSFPEKTDIYNEVMTDAASGGSGIYFNASLEVVKRT